MLQREREREREIDRERERVSVCVYVCVRVCVLEGDLFISATNRVSIVKTIFKSQEMELPC